MKHVVFLALLVPLTAAGQDLGPQVAAIGNGRVRLTYTAREGVCGDGHHSWHIRDTQDEDWVADCETGPIHVQLTMENRQVVDVDTWIGGHWRPERSADLDLGRVPAPAAAQYLLGLRVQGAAFAASLADSATVWPGLLTIARDQNAPERVRRDATFWLAQIAGDTAVQGLRELVDDPDREVRRAAVFALSQVHGGRAVELLLDIARHHRDPETRRSAIFWLGQSRDPRALDYFEEILRGS